MPWRFCESSTGKPLEVHWYLDGQRGCRFRAGGLASELAQPLCHCLHLLRQLSEYRRHRSLHPRVRSASKTELLGVRSIK